MVVVCHRLISGADRSSSEYARPDDTLELEPPDPQWSENCHVSLIQYDAGRDLQIEIVANDDGVRFRCSDAASYIHGATIDVDGGVTSDI